MCEQKESPKQIGLTVELSVELKLSLKKSSADLAEWLNAQAPHLLAWLREQSENSKYCRANASIVRVGARSARALRQLSRFRSLIATKFAELELPEGSDVEAILARGRQYRDGISLEFVAEHLSLILLALAQSYTWQPQQKPDFDLCSYSGYLAYLDSLRGE